MTKEWNTKQKRIFRSAVSVVAVLILAAVLFVGAGAAATELTDALVQTNEGNLTTGEYILNSDVTLTGKNIVIPKDNVVTIDLNGHTLMGNASAGRVITVTETTGDAVQPTKLTIKDSSGINAGKIIGGNGGGISAAVYTYLYFEGGNITGNTASTGAAITTATGTHVFMSGGVITNNTATGNGGALWIGNAYFTMTGGDITDNHADSGQGGGVWFAGSGGQELHLAGGNISGNTAKTGAGVYLRQDSYSIYLSGKLNITGNINSVSSAEENIRFENRKQYFTLDGNLDQSSKVNFTIQGNSRFLDAGNYRVESQDSLGIDNLDPLTQTVSYRSNNNWFIEPLTPVTQAEGNFSAQITVDGYPKTVYYKSPTDAFYDLPVNDNTIYCEKDSTISTETCLQHDVSAVLTSVNPVTLTCSVTPFSTSYAPRMQLTITGPIVFDGNNAASRFLFMNSAPSTVNIGTKGEETGYPIIKRFGSSGSMIYLQDFGTMVLNLYDCTIEENKATGAGLIEHQAGTINQYDGCTIKNSTGSSRIIGLRGGSSRVYNIYGGTIKDNKNTGEVIGIRDTGGTLNMYGGEIKNNTGVGISVSNSGFVCNLYGGSITENKGTNGGVYVSAGTFSISGNPVVKDNTNGNITLTGTKNITLSGALTTGADLRVKAAADVIAVGNGAYVPVAADSKYFASDAAKKVIYFNSTDNSLKTTDVKESTADSNGVATFGTDNKTAVNTGSGISAIVLENVTGLTPSATGSFVAANSTVGQPAAQPGMQSTVISVFDINVPGFTNGNVAKFNVTVTFDSDADATAKKSSIVFWHYNTTTSQWDNSPLTITATAQNGADVIYTVQTNSFSPFAIASESAAPAPAPQSSSSHSSSRNDGASVWLTATPTPVPTNAVPTAEPTQAAPVASPVKPQPTQTSASPAPLVGILAGLGAAAVFFGLRRT